MVLTGRDRVLDSCKALGDATRLQILGLLARGACNAGTLAAATGRSAGTVSHHMARLAAAGLVRMRREGTTHWFELDEAALRRLGHEVLTPAGLSALAGEPAAAEPVSAVPDPLPPPEPAETAPSPPAWTAREREVLAAFAPGDRLRALPVSRKNRECVLRWVMRHFTPDTIYTATALAALLELLAHDPHSLRRALLGEGWIERAEGGYRAR